MGWISVSVEYKKECWNACSGLKVNQWEKWTPHKYLERDFTSELQFNRKITINAMIHKNWLKPTKADCSVVPRWSGWWSQSYQIVIAVLLKWLLQLRAVVLWEVWSFCGISGSPLDLSSSHSVLNPQSILFFSMIYGQIQTGMLSTSPRVGNFTVEWCNPVSRRIFWGVLDGVGFYSCPLLGSLSHYGPLAEMTFLGWV